MFSIFFCPHRFLVGIFPKQLLQVYVIFQKLPLIDNGHQYDIANTGVHIYLPNVVTFVQSVGIVSSQSTRIYVQSTFSANSLGLQTSPWGSLMTLQETFMPFTLFLLSAQDLHDIDILRHAALHFSSRYRRLFFYLMAWTKNFIKVHD